MSGLEQLPHLLRLLDDDSADVQTAVRRELLAVGVELQAAIRPYLSELSPLAVKRLEEIWRQIRHEIFFRQWPDWVYLTDEADSIEEGFRMLGILQSNITEPDLADYLNDLADKYSSTEDGISINGLMKFLFGQDQEGFHSPEENYYHPRNSDLSSVIKRKEGLQISLSTIAILVGKRLGLELHGFNMPGHFMVMSQENEEITIYDVFNGGTPLNQEGIEKLENALLSRVHHLKNLKAEPHDIILRALRNIIKAYQKQGHRGIAARYQQYFEQVVNLLKKRGI